MRRIRPPVGKPESALLDKVADLTPFKRADISKNALASYHWIVRQTIAGAGDL